MGLKEYRARRDFRRTPEPAGKTRPVGNKPLMFCIQKHDATRLHYDLRLEMEGVLKSWAVPKGLPTRLGDKRLAVQVEDHPIEYGSFEGIIPEGYGAGTVMLWDYGTYSVPDGGDPLHYLNEGKLRIALRGKKLKGEWTLVRTRIPSRQDKPQWLVFKRGEDMKDISAKEDDRSVQTRRTMEQIAREGDRRWESDRQRERLTGGQGKYSVRPRSRRLREPQESTSEASPVWMPESVKKKLQKMTPEFVEPMKAVSSERLPRGTDWIYEMKFDGVRALAIRRDDTIELVSRAAKNFAVKYRLIAQSLPSLMAKEFVLDGEVVAVDEQGRSSFQLLQSYQMPTGKKPELLYYVFDIINLDGRDLRGLPLEQRKKIAAKLLADAPDRIRFSAAIKGNLDKLIKVMQARGLEGLMAKRKDSKYETGRRSSSWVKFKWTHEQEFVIGGYTPPKGTRANFGSLLVGYYKEGKLVFAGRVGTGFDQKLLRTLFRMFQPVVRADCPFVELPGRGGGATPGLTYRELKQCVWLEPEFVCQVRFSEWTRDASLRHPVFLGLREDKPAREVIRE